jgi:hypothetical protein
LVVRKILQFGSQNTSGDKTISTRGRGPWLLVYREDFETLPEAWRRERQLKSWNPPIYLGIDQRIDDAPLSAPRLRRGGRRFDPDQVHQSFNNLANKKYSGFMRVLRGGAAHCAYLRVASLFACVCFLLFSLRVLIISISL